MMQHTIMAVFDTARHAQVAVDDLLVCDIPSELIRQYPLFKGIKFYDAMRPENEFHRPPGIWTWLINDHSPPAANKARQEALYQESRARNERVLVTVECSSQTETRIRKILNDHAPLDVRNVEEGRDYADTSFAEKSQMDPSQFQPKTSFEMTRYL